MDSRQKRATFILNAQDAHSSPAALRRLSSRGSLILDPSMSLLNRPSSRASVIFDSPTRRPPSRTSSLSDHTSPPPSSGSSLRFVSPSLVNESSFPFPSEPSPTTPSTPRAPLRRHSRSKTFAGGDTRSYEERIALLEARNFSITGELEATRGMLNEEREQRSIARHSIALSPPPMIHELDDADVHEQPDVLYERNLRTEILETLKRVRGQNASLTRSLREFQDKCAEMRSIIDLERQEKKQMEDEIIRLSQVNRTLLEHNKLLAGRDAGLQEDISALLTKSQADDWMRKCLEDQLQLLRQKLPDSQQTDKDLELAVKHKRDVDQNFEQRSLAITLEDQGPLRQQLTSARDELHLVRLRLSDSETKCTELTQRIASLHNEMTLCLDSSGQALEVERELRAEVAEKASSLIDENASLKSTIEALREEVDALKAVEAERRKDHIAQAASALSQGQKPKNERRQSADRRRQSTRLRIAVSKKLQPQRIKRATPTLAGPPAFNWPSRSSSLDYPNTPDTSATLVSLPPQITPSRTQGGLFRLFRSPVAPRPFSLASDASAESHPPKSKPVPSTESPKASSLLSATLSKKSPSFDLQTLLKTDSTLYVDVNALSPDDTDPELRRKYRYRQSMQLQRASMLLAGIAQSMLESEFVFV
ncbi:hypothetical protein C8J56DRAFT_955570 [Mycena floridula]|nr:hypothetical protein C8J56DRAFT_955570 [Mycena floridula]